MPALGAGGVAQASYVSTILQDNPIGFWQLNETSGTTAIDSSGHGNNGTYTGGVALSQPGPFAGTTSAGFNGSDSSVSNINGTPLNLFLSNFTVESYSFGGASGDETILGNGTGTGGYSFGLNFGKIEWVYHGVQDVVSNVSVPLDGQFHYTAVTGAVSQNGTTLRFYLDGVFRQQISIAGIGRDSGNNVFSLGALQNDPLGTFPFNGNLAELAVYNTVLSDARILAHFQAGVPEPGSVLLLAIGLTAVGSATALRSRRRTTRCFPTSAIRGQVIRPGAIRAWPCPSCGRASSRKRRHSDRCRRCRSCR
jgi:hypothetical protein